MTVYDTTKIKDNVVVKEIERALSGEGDLPVNHNIRKQTWELKEDYCYGKEELTGTPTNSEAARARTQCSIN
jgi:hypothetical protein